MSVLSHSRTYPSPTLFHKSVYLVRGNIPISFSVITGNIVAVLPTQLKQPTQSHTYNPASIQHCPTSTYNQMLPILHLPPRIRHPPHSHPPRLHRKTLKPPSIASTNISISNTTGMEPTVDLSSFTVLTTLIRAILLTPITAHLTVLVVLHVLFIHLYAAWRVDLPILLDTLKRWLGIQQLIEVLENMEQLRYERRRIRARVDMVRRRVFWEQKMDMYRKMTRQAERELGITSECKMAWAREMGLHKERSEEYYTGGEERDYGRRLKGARRVADWVGGIE